MTYFVSAVVVLCVALFYGTEAIKYMYDEICPKVIPEFQDLDKLSGPWFEFVHSTGLGYSCTEYNKTYYRNESGIINTSAAKYHLDNGSISTLEGPIYYEDAADGLYKLTIDEGKTLVVFAVLGTDNSTYIIDWMCTQTNRTDYTVTFSLSTRSSTLPKGAFDIFQDALIRNNITAPVEIRSEGCKIFEK